MTARAANNIMRHLQRWALTAALLVIATCSKDKSPDQPAKLVPINPTIRVDRVWSGAVADKGAAPLRLGLGLAVDGNRIYAAGYRGDVVAFDLASGRTLWRTRTKAKLSGGTAAS